MSIGGVRDGEVEKDPGPSRDKTSIEVMAERLIDLEVRMIEAVSLRDLRQKDLQKAQDLYNVVRETVQELGQERNYLIKELQGYLMPEYEPPKANLLIGQDWAAGRGGIINDLITGTRLPDEVDTELRR